MRVVRRLLRYSFRYWPWLVLAIACMGAGVWLNLAVPMLTQHIIDDVIGGKQYGLLKMYALAVVGIAIGKGIMDFGNRYSMERSAQRVIYDLRNELYTRLQRLSFSFYDKAQTGQLMARVTGDVERLRQFLGQTLMSLISNGTVFLVVLYRLLRMNWRLTLVSLIAVPFLLDAINKFSKRVRPTYLAIQQQLAEMTSVLQENVTGVRVVRAFAQEDHERDKFRGQNVKFFDKNVFSVRMWAYYFPYMNFCTGLASVLVIWFGGGEVIRGRLTLGQLVAFNSYILQLVTPLRMLGWIVNNFTRASASGERVFELLDTEQEIKDLPGATDLAQCTGRVRLEHISFSYAKDDERLVLNGIEIDAQPGETVALLGATGSGKSTIINLIPRFYDVTGGQITVDGRDIRDLTLKSLRAQIGIVSQETFLFSTSIKENIAYGRHGATEAEVVAAAKAARIHDFIMTLPKGYETVVGERGVGLSGGQKQRVAIARALLMNPRILILDDSTSSVDTETEYLIQQALQNLMRNRTTFVIAQRLSTVKNANQIIVLKDGEVVERGRHAELLAAGGIYSEIYEMQLRPQEKNEDEFKRRAAAEAVAVATTGGVN